MSLIFIIFLFSSQPLKIWSLNGKKIIFVCQKLHKYWISTYYNLLPLHWEWRQMLFQLNPPTFLSKWANQRSKFASAVGRCRGYCRGWSPFHSIASAIKIPRQLNSHNFFKKIVFLELKKTFFVKEKKISSNCLGASIFIIHSFSSYLFNSLF